MIAALIPVKGVHQAKSRLAGVLPATERRALVLRLLDRTLQAVRGCRAIERVALTTPDRALADAFGTEWVPDAGSLNASLLAGVRWATEIGAAALLILPADLPLIEPGDVEAVVAAGKGEDGMAIATCLDGGTGALLLQPPDALSPSFGPDSYRRHVQLAERRGILIQRVWRGGLARDLDTEADLELLRSARVSSGK